MARYKLNQMLAPAMHACSITLIHFVDNYPKLKFIVAKEHLDEQI